MPFYHPFLPYDYSFNHQNDIRNMFYSQNHGKKKALHLHLFLAFFNVRNQFFAYHRPTLLLNRHLDLKTYFGNVFCSSLNNVVIVRSVL